MEIEIQAPVLVMPENTYGEDRAFYWIRLAEICNFREVELRVALSNTWVFMARLGQRRS